MIQLSFVGIKEKESRQRKEKSTTKLMIFYGFT